MRPAALLTLLLAIAASARADDFSRSGAYLGLGGTYASDFFEQDLEDTVEDLLGTPVDLNVDGSWGVNAVLGYRMLPFLATELQYEYIDSFQIEVSSPLPSQLDLSGHVMTLNLKLVLPTWRIQPYLLAGIGGAFYTAQGRVLSTDLFENDEWVFAGRVGAGIDFYLTRHLVLNAAATTVLTADEVSSNLQEEDIGGLNFVAVQVGLQFRF